MKKDPAGGDGGSVRFGTLLAKAETAGHLDMRYQHGRLRLHEAWRWTGGAEGEGVSIIEEMPPA